MREGVQLQGAKKNYYYYLIMQNYELDGCHLSQKTGKCWQGEAGIHFHHTGISALEQVPL